MVLVVALWLRTTWSGSDAPLVKGRILTVRRPQTTGAGLFYALAANLLTGGSALDVRALSDTGVISPRHGGFRGSDTPQSPSRSGWCSGSVLYAVQGAPKFKPRVVTKAFARVLG